MTPAVTSDSRDGVKSIGIQNTPTSTTPMPFSTPNARMLTLSK